MTLPTSGAIGLFAIADEFGLAHDTPFPAGFYGKGGAPGFGALSFGDFYGRSSFTLSQDTSSIGVNGNSGSDQANITSTISTTFTFTLLSGGGGGRITLGPTSGTATYIRITTPANGSGAVDGTYRVTAANGDSVTVDFSAEWGI